MGFLVIDVTWKLFIETGNIETYLLLKELENEPSTNDFRQMENEEVVSLNTKM